MERLNGYAPIAGYALLGNGQGCALVALDGSVDWFAAPSITTEPLLAAILDSGQGGRFVIQPTGRFDASRKYIDSTMVLETTFETDTGVLKVTDAMTVGVGCLPWNELARRLEVLRGSVEIRWELQPGNRLASSRPWVHRRDGRPFVLAGDMLAALVADSAGEQIVNDGSVRGTTVLEQGRRALLAVVSALDAPLMVPDAAAIDRRIDGTVRFWQEWSQKIRYDGPFSEELRRSILTIAALRDSKTGALAAAPTTSLPEAIGKERNFDYRFGWVRDGSFMLDAFADVELYEEMDDSLRWLLAGASRTAPDLHVFYKLNGRPPDADEKKLEVLDGYRGTRPVVLGNNAASQRQIGSYGDLFGAVNRHVQHGAQLNAESAVMLAGLADRLCDIWPLPGAGLWELGDDRNYTSSLINSWAALNSAVDLAKRGQLADMHAARWSQTADAVHDWTDEHCWSSSKQSYTFYAGTDDLDASVLLAARTGYLAGGDPRLRSTIDAIRRELTADGPWLYRYTGADQEEHAFVCCTFWMIEALSHAGRTAEAKDLLDAALSWSNDVDLWSEEIDTLSGAFLGNFPLGLSHLSVVGAIHAYNRVAQP